MNHIVGRYRVLALLAVAIISGLAILLMWHTSSSDQVTDAIAAIADACGNFEGNYNTTGSATSISGLKETTVIQVRYSSDNLHGVTSQENTLLKDELIIITQISSELDTVGLAQSQSKNEGGEPYIIHYSRSTDNRGEWSGWEVDTQGGNTKGTGSSGLEVQSDSSDNASFCWWPAEYFDDIKSVGKEDILGIKTTHYVATRSQGWLGEEERYDFWVDESTILVRQKWDWDGAVTLFTYSGWGEPNIIVAPVTGTLHEAFIDVGASGGAVGFTSAAGELVSAGFTVDGSATTIQELTWQNGTVSLTLSPQNTLTGYVLDFFAVDGTVSLSLDAATAASGKLSWPVASQPWQDGDHLMLRIRETGSTPILPPTPEPTATPTPAPLPTSAPTATPRPDAYVGAGGIGDRNELVADAFDHCRWRDGGLYPGG